MEATGQAAYLNGGLLSNQQTAAVQQLQSGLQGLANIRCECHECTQARWKMSQGGLW